MPDSALPPNLKGKKHWDWPWPLSYVPRGWTAFKWGRPVLLWGNIGAWWQTAPAFDLKLGLRPAPKPISPRGTWQVSRFPGAPWWAWPALFISISGSKLDKKGKYRNYRIGARWDDVNDYVNWVPFMPSSRKYSGDDSQDTST